MSFVHVGGTFREVAMKVVQEQEEDNAFYVCDLRELKNRVRLWRQELPRVVPHYAIKACTDPVVMQTLACEEVNFDCSNKWEIEVLVSAGIDVTRIIYANPAKQTSHLEFAKNVGVTLMTFDCAEELEKISDKKARLLLRIKVQTDALGCKMASKFGCSLEEAASLLHTAISLGLSVIGVAFHAGAINYSPEAFTLGIAQAREVFDIANELGMEMSVLDIGGGFPGGIRKRDSFEKICQAVRDALDLHFPESSGISVIAEPGQYMVTAPYTMAAKVIAKRTRQTSIDGALCYHHDVYLNASKENCVPREMYTFLDISYQPLNPPYNRARKHLTTLWGATCHPLDKLEDCVPFFEVSVGEWLAIDNVGAYGMVNANGFNGTGFPPVHYITDAEDAPRVAHFLEASPLTPGYSQPLQAMKKSSSRGITPALLSRAS
ncbi:ornithine decarboxylase-like [Dermacentor albipictus]|uniref:ornithine decarboxylase-like n=1 Tax=Dermacentor albipictus TaxID=60249 RepID=UPI0031FBE241